MLPLTTHQLLWVEPDLLISMGPSLPLACPTICTRSQAEELHVCYSFSSENGVMKGRYCISDPKVDDKLTQYKNKEKDKNINNNNNKNNNNNNNKNNNNNNNNKENNISKKKFADEVDCEELRKQGVPCHQCLPGEALYDFLEKIVGERTHFKFKCIKVSTLSPFQDYTS